MGNQAPSTQEFVQLPARRRQSRMIEPALLLVVLERGGTHGYDIREQVQRLGLADTDIDGSAVYRCLRWLEKQGQVRSRWDTSSDGPAKRCYELTDLGLKSLALWADLLKSRRAALDRYLDRYRKAIAKVRRYRRL